MPFSRRSFLSVTGLSTLGISAAVTRAWGQPAAAPPAVASADVYPGQDPASRQGSGRRLARQLRAACARLSRSSRRYARASMDWGFGDWETCIDAAAHVGNKPIADFLLSHGARPTIFSAAMMGQLDAVKAFVAARPGIQKTLGPHGITLMSHARAGGADAAPVVQYLKQLGDADTPHGHATARACGSRCARREVRLWAGAARLFHRRRAAGSTGHRSPVWPGAARPVHTGNLVFFPAGVPTVKIAFARDGAKVTQLTVADPDVMVTAGAR